MPPLYQFAQVLVAVAAIEVATRVLVLWKPWRKHQRRPVVAVGATVAVLLTWGAAGHTTLERAWTLCVAIGGTSAVLLIAGLFIRNRRAYFPPAKTAGAAEALHDPVIPFHKPGTGALADTFALLANSQLTRWRPPEGEHPTVTFRRHSLIALDPLLAAYGQTGDRRFLNKAEALVQHWINHNSWWVFNPPSTFSWGDHSTALRLCRLLAFWQAWADPAACRQPLATDIRRSILAHARLLSTPGFYWARHNHGIDQDIALLQASYFLPEAAEARAWRDTAWGRLWSTLGALISPGGVMREHSPAYHVSTLKHLAALATFVSRRGDDDNAQRLMAVAEQMAGFAAHLIEPGGTLVPFGDTDADIRATDDPGLQRLAGKDGTLAYCMTAGALGTPPPRVTSRAGDGYIFIREAMNAGPCSPDSWYLAFTGASHLHRAHKHGDDLSLILTGAATAILADPGLYSYSGDAWRHYFVSRVAHNTVAVESPRTKVTDFPTGDGRTVVYPPEEEGSTVLLGGQRTFDEGTHDRAVLWISRTGLLVVDRVDRMRTASPRGPASLSWHLGAQVEADLEADGTVVLKTAAGGFCAAIRLHCPAGTSWGIVRGKTDPIQGWLSPQRDVRAPATVLTASSHVEPAVFVTEILLPRPGERAPARGKHVVQGEVKVQDHGVEVPINLDGCTARLQLLSGKPPRLLGGAMGTPAQREDPSTEC